MRKVYAVNSKKNCNIYALYFEIFPDPTQVNTIESPKINTAQTSNNCIDRIHVVVFVTIITEGNTFQNC